MSKSKKKLNPTQGAAEKSRSSCLVQEDDAYTPFANIKLVESKKVEKKAPVKKAVEKKAVIGGFDPSADFGDILRQWEATGDPYAMPGKHVSDGPGVGRRLKKGKEADSPIKKMTDTSAQAKKDVQSMDFATIFAQWENGQQKKQEPAKVEVKSKSRVISSGPKKDFSQILEEWEACQSGKKPPVVKKSEEPKRIVVAEPEPVVSVQEEEVEDPQLDDPTKPRPVWSGGKATGYVTERVSGGGGFADIYDAWAAQQQSEDELLASAIEEKEKDHSVTPKMELSKLRQMLPQVTLDLHGLTGEEAQRRVQAFLQESQHNGIQKLCIIHGKGIHTPGGQGVLKDIVVKELERSKLVREFAAPAARYGGSGVMWILLKDK